MDPAGTDALLDAIRHMHGCEAAWLGSVPGHGRRDGSAGVDRCSMSAV